MQKKKMSNKDLVWGINFTLNHQIDFMEKLKEVHQKDIDRLEKKEKNLSVQYQLAHHKTYNEGLQVGLDKLIELKETLIKNAGK